MARVARARRTRHGRDRSCLARGLHPGPQPHRCAGAHGTRRLDLPRARPRRPAPHGGRSHAQRHEDGGPAVGHRGSPLPVAGKIDGRAKTDAALRAAGPADRTGATMNAIERGTVYGTLMNFRGELDAIGAKMNEAPYKAPPQAPVLYIKPANTWSENGAVIRLP